MVFSWAKIAPPVNTNTTNKILAKLFISILNNVYTCSETSLNTNIDFEKKT
jgi:hypothetical protein